MIMFYILLFCTIFFIADLIDDRSIIELAISKIYLYVYRFGGYRMQGERGGGEKSVLHM